MSSSKASEDQFQETDQSIPDQTEPQADTETPSEPQGFWQQPTEPLERNFHGPESGSKKDRE